jgi:hypothetical protein
MSLNAIELDIASSADVPKLAIANGNGNLWTQVWMLLWKNFTLKKKRPLSTLCELALPLIIVLLLSWIRSLDEIKPKTVDVGKGKNY